MRFLAATVLLLVALIGPIGSIAPIPAAKADGRTLMGYGLNLNNYSWTLQAYNMGYNLGQCAQLCEYNNRCVAWQLQGDGSQARYTCRLLDQVAGAPRPMADNFFGFSSRYR